MQLGANTLLFCLSQCTIPFCTLSAVMFKTQNLILDYCVDPVPEFCLSGVTLISCFKVVLTVALSGYVIKLSSQ